MPIADSARLNGDQRERTAARGLSGYECLENGGRLSVMTLSEGAGAGAGAGDDLAGVGDRVRAAGGVAGCGAGLARQACVPGQPAQFGPRVDADLEGAVS
jgi:hypothetical protein